VPGVVKGRVFFRVLPGACDLQRALHVGSSNMIDQVDGSGIRASLQVHVKAELAVVDHDRIGPRDGSGKDLISCVNQGVIRKVERRGHAIKDPSSQAPGLSV
jgi:hypothetical protein